MVTGLGQWGLLGLRFLGIALSSWTEYLVPHGGTCCSENSFDLWSGYVSGTCWRNSECGMGCDCACCYYGTKGNGGIH